MKAMYKDILYDVICTSLVTVEGRRSCLLLTVQHGSHIVTLGRYARPASGGVSLWPEQILCRQCCVGRCPCSCYCRSARPCFVMVIILESLMSWGAAPSCQHWQRTSCSGSSNLVLHCLIKSGIAFCLHHQRLPTLPLEFIIMCKPPNRGCTLLNTTIEAHMLSRMTL